MATTELERLGAGREAEIFAWHDGRVLRLARDPLRHGMIEREATALAAAHAAGANVPGVHERVTVAGRPAVVLNRVDGATCWPGWRATPGRSGRWRGRSAPSMRR